MAAQTLSIDKMSDTYSMAIIMDFLFSACKTPESIEYEGFGSYWTHYHLFWPLDMPSLFYLFQP